MKGSIYQRKEDGRWTGYAYTHKDEFGKWHKKTVYGETESEVQKKINIVLYEIQTGEYRKPVNDTFIDFLRSYHNICAGCDMWEKDYKRPAEAKWEATTAELYKMYIDIHFAPYFREMKLKDVKPMVLDKFYNFKLSEETVRNNRTYKMSNNTVRKLNGFLKAAFNYAIVNNDLKDNPASHVVLAKKKEYKPVVYNQDQFGALLDHVSGTDDEIPIILGGGCGLRRGEIFGLYWRNVDLTNKTITIEKTNVRFKKYTEKKPKTETSQRTIAAPGYVVTILKLYKVRSKHAGPNDKVITRWKPGAYSDRFNKLLDKFGLPHIRLHDLRHYNAVIMMKKNVPDKVAAGRLGHANVSTLRKVYQHVLNDMDVSAADLINDTMETKSSHQEVSSQ